MLSNVTQVFFTFLRLGLTSFGGPIAHLSYFHDEFVKRKKWIDEHTYADLVALCQFLPGPASSQVGMALGLLRGGYLGSLAAWLGFTLPSAIILVLFGLGLSSLDLSPAWLHGLKVVAVAIVAQAIWNMAAKLCSDKVRASIAIVAAVVSSNAPSAWIQVLVIMLGGILGLIFLRKSQPLPHAPLAINVSHGIGFALLLVFSLLLALLPLLARVSGSQELRLFDAFFRAGSFVFGGGHVVLPLLQAEIVSTGWVSKDLFMAGYGAAQAIPGPLFAISAYLGTVSSVSSSSWLVAAICLIGAFLPSYLLIVGTLPFWERIRKHNKIRYAMQGINATVVGLLLSAFYNPVWTSAIYNAKDFALAIFCFLLLTFWSAPSWMVVLLSALISAIGFAN